MLTYALPDGRLVEIPYDLARARPFIDFTLKGGRVVWAHLVASNDEISVAYRAWKNR